jgi:uncharacterized YccA/Bax inhibitor family protein
MFRTNNPALKPDVFAPAQTWDQFVGAGKTQAAARPTTMTLQGTVIASGVLLAITTAVAMTGWSMIKNDHSLMLPIWGLGALGGFIIGLIICFKPRTSPVLAPFYAICEGAFVAGASIGWTSIAESGSRKAAALGPDLVIQAGLLTFGISAAMLIAYATRLVKPSQRMLGGIAAATGGVIIFSFAMFLLSWFMPGIIVGFWTSPIGLVFAGVVVVIAAMNLVLDFAIIEDGVQNGAPKYMEWYGAFGLLVTLVWLYVSILRLLALLNRRN